MSKLILWNLVTLDGFFEGPTSWSLDFLQYAWEAEMQSFSLDQLASADGLLFGRITYTGMASFWQKAADETARYMNSLPKFVFSRTLEYADWNNTTLVKDDPVASVKALKQQGAGNLFVFGSGQICELLLSHGLFDEVRIAVVPIVIGSGKTLFGRDLGSQRLRLIESRPMSSGTVILRYEPLPTAASEAHPTSAVSA